MLLRQLVIKTTLIEAHLKEPQRKKKETQTISVQLL